MCPICGRITLGGVCIRDERWPKHDKAGVFMKSIFLPLLSFCAVLVFAQASYAQSVNDVRLNKLFTLYRMNMAGDAFIRHCQAGELVRGTYYLGNIKAVEFMLTREVMKQRGEVTTGLAQEMVAQRRERYMIAANEFYQKNGCESNRAKAALAHVEKMSKAPTAQLLIYLRDIENR
jgi:hypothetical protein